MQSCKPFIFLLFIPSLSPFPFGKTEKWIKQTLPFLLPFVLLQFSFLGQGNALPIIGRCNPLISKRWDTCVVSREGHGRKNEVCRVQVTVTWETMTCLAFQFGPGQWVHNSGWDYNNAIYILSNYHLL